MPLKNYTTEVSALKSIGEIQGKLVAHGARSILMNYSKSGEPESLSFIITTLKGEVPFRLPANITQVEKLLTSMRVRTWDIDQKKMHEKALRVGWRIIRDWIDAQIAIIDTEMVTLEEVFLPYMVCKGGQSLYQLVEARGYLLTEGKQ